MVIQISPEKDTSHYTHYDPNETELPRIVSCYLKMPNGNSDNTTNDTDYEQLRIVEDLVLARYGYLLDRTLERSSTRRFYEQRKKSEFFNSLSSNEKNVINLMEYRNSYDSGTDLIDISTESLDKSFIDLSSSDDILQRKNFIRNEENPILSSTKNTEMSMDSVITSKTERNLVENWNEINNLEIASEDRLSSSISTNISALLSKENIHNSTADTTMSCNTRENDEMLQLITIRYPEITDIFNSDCIDSDDPSVIEITNKILKEIQILIQASKALKFCKDSIYAQSTYRLEAERLLLISGFRKALLERQLMYEEKDDVPHISGDLILHNLKLYAKLENYEKQMKEKHREHYIFLVRYKNQFLATNTLKMSNEFIISCVKPLCLKNLSPKFQINVMAFLARLPSKKCSKISKFFTRNRHKHEISRSLFTFCGGVCLKNKDLRGRRIFPLTYSCAKSKVTTFTIDIERKLHMTVRAYGFLTISKYTGNCPLWRRYWCVMEDCLLKYWYFPYEEELKNPIQTLDLTYCVNDSFCEVERMISLGSCTFCLEFYNGCNRKDRTTYLFSADTKEDYMYWKYFLEGSLKELKDWHALKYFY